MTDIEAEQFIMRCRRVLPKWQREIEGAVGEARSDAEAARDSLLDTLRGISVDFPAQAEEVWLTTDSRAKLQTAPTHRRDHGAFLDASGTTDILKMAT